MNTFDRTMTAQFRAALVERARQLGEMLEHETLPAADTVHDVGDFKDVAVQDALAEIDEAQAAHAAVELDEIRAAMRRMQDGSYGSCADCDDPIDLRRLVALPAAACCASCQSAHERGAALSR